MPGWLLDSAGPIPTCTSGLEAGAFLMEGTKLELPAQEEESRELKSHKQKHNSHITSDTVHVYYMQSLYSDLES